MEQAFVETSFFRLTPFQKHKTFTNTFISTTASMDSYVMWLAICKDRGTGGNRHWILMLSEGDSNRATWYHSTGGPTQGKPYKVCIDRKRLDSHGVDTHHRICEISAKDKNKVKAAAHRAPAKRCQRWVVEVLGDLEKREIVPEGTWELWSKAIEADPISDDGGSSTQSE
ncbi:hypothetical protein ACHAPU_003073 [Fusarium lateritium]